jgi:hypothetical protein
MDRRTGAGSCVGGRWAAALHLALVYERANVTKRSVGLIRKDEVAGLY